jgi:hypothetical protein
VLYRPASFLPFKDDPIMGFLSGPVSFQCFQIEGDASRQFGPADIKILQKFAISEIAASAEQPGVGFLAGDHLLDLAFSQEKNVIGEALHPGVQPGEERYRRGAALCHSH